MIKRNSFGFKHIKVPTSNFSSWSTSSRRTVFTRRHRKVSDIPSRTSTTTIFQKRTKRMGSSRWHFLLRNMYNFFWLAPLVPLYGCRGFSFIILIISQTVGLLGRVIGLSQGRYLNTGQHKHRKTHTHTKQPCPEWDSNLRSRPPSERRQCMP
jgi:hypothetical protein